MALPIGARVGPYEVTGTLGAGGMGEVYRARDTRLKRDVALKVLPASFAADPERLARFQGEAEMLASLNHPNVAALYGLEAPATGSGQGGDTTALIMELVEGPTLAERIAHGPIPVEDVVPIARQIAEALEAAHEQGIIHRDLKPSNIKVRADGTVKVLDFGLAKAMEPAGTTPIVSQTPTLTAAQKTRAGMVLGTPGYMSPEQARGKPVDKRTDIWAFGCVLYELLAGRVAFAGETVSDMLVSVLSREPDWKVLPEAVPPALRSLVRRCLEKDPRQRLRDIGDARIELEAGAVSFSANDPVSGNSPRTPPSGVSRRRVLASGAALGLLGLGVGAGAFAWGRARTGTSPSYQRLTYRRGLIRSARFAPDYQTVLYGALWDGDVCRIYSVRPESPESVPLDLPPATPLAVSASGELALALGPHLRGIMTYGTLARVPMAGGVPREMVEATKFADWSPNGRDLAIVRRAGNRDVLEFPVGTVVAEPSTPSGGFSFPRVSPDGDRVAFFELAVAGGLGGRVAIVDRRAGKRFVSPPYPNAFGLAWKGDEIWFTAADERPLFRNVIHAVTPDGVARIVARIPGNASLHDVTPSGRVLMARTDDRSGITVLSPGQTAERDLNWLDASTPVALSRDGQTLLFTESGVGGGAGGSVYLRGTSGSPAVRLGDGAALALSPDGKWVLARQLGPSSPYLTLLPTGPGQTRRIEHPGTIYFNARWTPENTRVVVRAQESSRPPRIYVLDLDKGSLDPITPDSPAADGSWALSPDGAMVAVATASAVVLYPITGGEGRPTPGLTGRQVIVGWIVDGLLVSEGLSPVALGRVFQVDPASGRRSLWREFVLRDPAGVMNVGSPVVTPDGRAYSYGWHRAISDLYLVDGLA